MPEASHIYRNKPKTMTSIPAESYIYSPEFCVRNGSIVRLLRSRYLFIILFAINMQTLRVWKRFLPFPVWRIMVGMHPIFQTRMPEASNIYSNATNSETSIPEESYIAPAKIFVRDETIIQLLPESGSIPHFTCYKYSNPAGFGRFFYFPPDLSLLE